MKNWTEKDIRELHRKGKVRNYRPRKREIRDTAGAKVNFRPVSKEKDWIAYNLAIWANEHSMILEEEYRFHPTRKWRADWAISALRVLIEYEGLMSAKSRHTSVKGFTGDTDKYREAAKAGWIVLRYTALNYKQVIQDLDEIDDRHPK